MSGDWKASFASGVQVKLPQQEGESPLHLAPGTGPIIKNMKTLESGAVPSTEVGSNANANDNDNGNGRVDDTLPVETTKNLIASQSEAKDTAKRNPCICVMVRGDLTNVSTSVPLLTLSLFGRLSLYNYTVIDPRVREPPTFGSRRSVVDSQPQARAVPPK